MFLLLITKVYKVYEETRNTYSKQGENNETEK
jgi:hypothetical protein